MGTKERRNGRAVFGGGCREGRPGRRLAENGAVAGAGALQRHRGDAPGLERYRRAAAASASRGARCRRSPAVRSPGRRLTHPRGRHLLGGTPTPEGRLWRAPSSRWGGLKWPLVSRSTFPGLVRRLPPPSCTSTVWKDAVGRRHSLPPLPLCRGRKATSWRWGWCCVVGPLAGAA